MKNKIKWLSVIAFIAIIGFALTGCEEVIGPQGEQGDPGTNGSPGSVVEIKMGIDQEGYPNLTWWIDGVDTNIAVAGKDGDVGTLDSVLTIGANGNWFIDGDDTGRPARGPAGADGTNGTIITFDGNPPTWWIDGADTGIPLTGPKGDPGTIGSILSICPDTGNWVIDGVDTGVSATPSSSACIHLNQAWRYTIPMINIVSLMEEQYCTTCNLRTSGRRPTYENLTRYLQRQSSGTSTNNPIELEIAIALGTTTVDTGGWGDLLHVIQAAGKYVSLDLSASTANASFQTGTFSTGKSFIVHITYPYSATTAWADTAFTNLKSVRGYAGIGTFTNITSLTEISFPNATSTMSNSFQGCTGLIEVSLPNVTIINANSFDGCTNLERISIPRATTLHQQAFRNCTSLERVYLPNVTSTQSTGTFENCTSLTYVNLPRVNNITNNTFLGCTNLKEVFVAAATMITDGAFSGCTSLERVYIPLVRSIGQNAFLNCDVLTYITIARNATINATGLSVRAAAFKAYYEDAWLRTAGTYTFDGTNWNWEVPASPPSAPQNLAVSAVGIQQVTLSWTTPSNINGSPITKYEVSNNNGTSWTDATSSTGHTFTSLAVATYTFKVRAVNGVGNGAEASLTFILNAGNQTDPLPLTERLLSSGSIANNQTIWHSFPVTSGTRYRLYSLSTGATANVTITAQYEDGTSISLGGWGNMGQNSIWYQFIEPFTANRNGYVRIAVTSTASGAGTYAVAYGIGNDVHQIIIP